LGEGEKYITANDTLLLNSFLIIAEIYCLCNVDVLFLSIFEWLGLYFYNVNKPSVTACYTMNIPVYIACVSSINLIGQFIYNND